MATISSYTKAQLDTILGAKAPTASPTFTGTVVAPTPTAGDNTTKVATTAFVTTAVAAGGGGGGGAVSSVAGRTGAVVLAEADITGLVADLAAKAPLTTRIVRDIGQMDSTVSTASSVGTVGRAFVLADATNSSVGATVDFPADWTTYNVDVWSCVIAASSGNVTLLYQPLVLTDGYSLATTAVTAATASITPSGTTFVVKKDRIASGITADHSGPTYVKILRSGNDAGDTTTAGLAILRIDLTKAS